MSLHAFPRAGLPHIGNLIEKVRHIGWAITFLIVALFGFGVGHQIVFS